ncbi:MAG TPA: hypothetical protein VGQ45_03895 [Gaiellales bacterium]|jgi:hypothetical protein|nr:hypothetical protein [Gaiellales bacterium]
MAEPTPPTDHNAESLRQHFEKALAESVEFHRGDPFWDGWRVGYDVAANEAVQMLGGQWEAEWREHALPDLPESAYSSGAKQIPVRLAEPTPPTDQPTELQPHDVVRDDLAYQCRRCGRVFKSANEAYNTACRAEPTPPTDLREQIHRWKMGADVERSRLRERIEALPLPQTESQPAGWRRGKRDVLALFEEHE